MPGPKPRGDHALKPAEGAAAYRERRKATVPAPPVVVRYRRPKDRRSKPQRWTDAVATLLDVLDGYQEWRDAMPAGIADSALAERLDEVLALRDDPHAELAVAEQAALQFEVRKRRKGMARIGAP